MTSIWTNNDEKEMVSITIVEKDGPKLLDLSRSPSIFSAVGGGRGNHESSAFNGQTHQGSTFPMAPLPATVSTASSGSSPQPGDSIEPNNYIPLEDANPFVCIASITMGSTSNRNVDVLPSRISLTTLVGRDYLIYDLRVSFTNKLGETAAALMSIPCLPDILILEEEHECGDIKYKPKVEEKERATAEYQEAASSSDKTATLSETSDDAHHFRMDKVPAGATATFGVKFIQWGGLKLRDAVLPSVGNDSSNIGEEKRSIADLAIMPGFTCFDCPVGGVPFDFELILTSKALHVELPEHAVMLEDLKAANQGFKPASGERSRKRDILSIVQLSPSLMGSQGKSLRWKSVSGLARGTLLKIRIVEKTTDNLVGQISKMTLEGQSTSVLGSSDLLANSITEVDTIEGVCFDSFHGLKCDSTLLNVTIPFALPHTLSKPSPNRHVIYVIVDTSGSTSMPTGEGGQMFLDTSKTLLNAILRKLPDQISVLRRKKVINDLPVTVRLWSFDNDTRMEADTTLSTPQSPMEANPILSLLTKVESMRPGGCTNYDSWADKLRACVGHSPSDLHSVLLVTDGGATSRERFFDAIDAISANVKGFFQVDTLGYGPWLDPKCVSHLAAKTGGEALMVESLEGDGVRTKVLSILARSLARAASQLALQVENGKLLAVQTIGSDEEVPPNVQFVPRCLMKIDPGQTVRMIVLHPSGKLPEFSLVSMVKNGNQEKIPWPRREISNFDCMDGWEMVETHEMKSSALLNRLSHPNTIHALRHLPLLEPTYAPPGRINHPAFHASERIRVMLHTSLLGQVVAPSVTKGIAVVALKSTLAPVPEHCYPEASGMRVRYSGNLIFKDDPPPFHGQSSNFCTGGLFSSAAYDPSAASSASLSPMHCPARFGAASKSFAPLPSLRPFAAPPMPAYVITRGLNTGKEAFFQAPLPLKPSVGFKITSPFLTQPRIPSLLDWIVLTRGGIFLYEANRLKKTSTTGIRLTRKELETKLSSDFRNAVYKLKSANDPISIPNITVESVLLRTIECAVAVNPNGTGPMESFEKWMATHYDDLSALTSTLVFAAASCGISLSATQLKEIKNWPWISDRTVLIDLSDKCENKTIESVDRKGMFAAHQATVPSANELVDRTAQVPLFTPTVRRDIYRVLVNPDHPNEGLGARPKTKGNVPFGAVLLALATDGKTFDTFAFTNQDITETNSLPQGYTILDETMMLDAITNIGNTTPNALAVTRAFEDYLRNHVSKWGDEQASCLSVEFLVAFGNEMTPRLDIHHRIRSKKLSAEEVRTLSCEPFSRWVDQAALKTFQGHAH